MIQARLQFSSFLVLLLTAASAVADNSPEGRWITKDEKTGVEQSVIEIWRDGDQMKGRIAEILVPEEGKELCVTCSGEQHMQPVLGLTIISEFRQKDDRWVGGRVMDPNTGSVYKGTMQVVDGGETLKLRGYIGIKALGRTQYWRRQPAAEPASASTAAASSVEMPSVSTPQ